MNRASASTDRDLIQRAFEHTARVAKHYENFTVVSLLLPKRLKQHFYNVYALCRYADDLADEIGNREESCARLSRLGTRIRAMYANAECRMQNAESREGEEDLMLVALGETARQFEIPADPFLKLIDAFEQDQRVNRYETYDQLRDYCRRSADPVGHLVLYLCGYRDAERQRLSDYTCTALQLTNFWQDVASDLDRGRIYIPLEDLRRFGVNEADILAKRTMPQFFELMKFEVDRAEGLFTAGEALLPLVDKRVRTDIALYGRGGRAILHSIREIGYDTLSRRPTLSKWCKLKLLAGYLVGL